MNKFLDWITTSSANPDEYSATFKGILVMFIPMVIFIAQAFHLSISENTLMSVVQVLTAFYASILVVFGIGRKLYVMLKNIDISSSTMSK